MEKPYLGAEVISERLRTLAFPEVEGIVAILRGGLVPAFMVAHQLGGLPVRLLGLNLRDEANALRREVPELTIPLDARGWEPGMRLLLIDDVSVSGRTFERARSFLEGFAVTTFALKGRADIVAFPEIEGCVRWPWHGGPGAKG